MSKDTPKQWDRIIKMLMQANPQDFVSWILTDAIYESERPTMARRKV